MNTKVFNAELSAVARSDRPAIRRVLISVGVDGGIHIVSSTDAEATIGLLDRAMESIDGQRLPQD